MAEPAGKPRNTRQKQVILRLLRESGVPLTAAEIFMRARAEQPALAKSTVYRNLDAMLADSMVTQGRLESGESYYVLTDPDSHVHRHYLICRRCGRMQDLPECPLGDMERTLADSCGFTVTDHVLQLYGYCRDCRNGGEQGGCCHEHGSL